MEKIIEIENSVEFSNRDKISYFEEKLSQCKDVTFGDNENFPLKHSFSEGIYVREIFIPAGSIVVGKIHLHDHPNFLLSGEVSVFTEHEGVQILKGPLSMISKKATKRVVYAHTDTVWVTVHLNPSNTQDLKRLEEEIIAPNYEALENKNTLKIKGVAL